MTDPGAALRLPEADHGGALDEAMARFGGAEEDWLDLSTGINPAPPPLPALPSNVWTRLPGAALEQAAIAAARRFYGAPEEAGIVAAAGSQALISALPHLFAPTFAVVVEPTYSEHRAALEEAGHRVSGIADLVEVPPETQLAVVVNPNNPDGRRFRRLELLALAERLGRSGGLLIVDEAFMDVDPGMSLAPDTGREGLLVHRSFGKFFGLAGLRLGFALTTPMLAARLNRRRGPWAVSGPALHLARTLMPDDALVEGLRQTIRDQSQLLARRLTGAGATVCGSTELFALIRHPDAARLFAALCRRHVLTRPFDYRNDWLRIGNVADHGQADRLETSLRHALTEVAAGRSAP